MFIISYGDILNGFSFVGPYVSREDALEAADHVDLPTICELSPDAASDDGKHVSDAWYMDRIASIMSGGEWNADTLDEIRDVLEASGRSVDEPNDEGEGEDEDETPNGPYWSYRVGDFVYVIDHNDDSDYTVSLNGERLKSGFETRWDAERFADNHGAEA